MLDEGSVNALLEKMKYAMLLSFRSLVFFTVNGNDALLIYWLRNGRIIQKTIQPYN